MLYLTLIITLLLLILYLNKKNKKSDVQGKNIESGKNKNSDQFNQDISSRDIIKLSGTSIDFERLTIPKNRQELLYISKGDPFNVGLSHSIHFNITNSGVESEMHGPNEPSTIFIKQPIKKPANPDLVREMGYYPSYAQMDPYQRWIYLNWLCDISKPIDIGYVFTYYYGLERQLIDGKFEEAFNEINLLREYHKNASFQSYSLNALINAVNIKKRFDLLESVTIDDGYDKISNSALYVSYKLKLDLYSDILISIVNSISGTNRRYINNNREIYKKSLEEVLNKKYSNAVYPFTKEININDVKKKEVNGFANFSLPDEYRLLSYPDFLNHKKFTSDVLSCHNEAHEITKAKLREFRKQSNKNT